MRITNFAAFGFNEELARVEAQGASEPASERQDQEPLE
jgi:hypothetical protein